MCVCFAISARIKCHRFCAFSDAPVFVGRHCDLKGKAEAFDTSQELRVWPSCSCSSLMAQNMCTPTDSTSLTSVSPHSHHSPTSASDTSAALPASFPFTSHQSAKLCLKGALNIAQSFDDVPYPNPYAELCLGPPTLSPTSSIVAPRTMPSFACCAMQCAYALLMVYEKTKSMYPESGTGGPMVQSLLVRLQGGLTSISGTLENYATAFEALGGMRGKSSLPPCRSRGQYQYQCL